jgi:hypothetical protein
MMHIFLCLQVANELVSLEGSDATLPKRGKGLIKDIEAFTKKRQKDNRILAKNVAEWVDVAMNTTAPPAEPSSLQVTSISEHRRMGYSSGAVNEIANCVSGGDRPGDNGGAEGENCAIS